MAEAKTHSFPLMPPRSTEARLAHFGETVYKADPTTVIYRLIDALCGDAGAGDLKKQTFMRRLSNALENIYFSDLDFIFGGMGFLSRTESESYEWDPANDMLTSAQWDEVRVKDAWYRARIRDYFIAVGRGGTPEGIRMAVMAATSADCDLYETWRYVDNFGITSPIGRTPGGTARNEVVIKPHKAGISPKLMRLLRQMLNRMTPADAIITVDPAGLAVHDPVPVKAAAADSNYYEVQKEVTGTPVLAELPPPELLAIDLRPSEKWLLSGNPETAPYAAFNISQEYGYYYLASGGARSPIDSVSYGTLQADGSVKPEPNHEDFAIIEQYTQWFEYDKADSPDNYPGGKFGLHPETAPAVNPDGSPYVFQYESQAEYVAQARADILVQGGQADFIRYRLPIIGKSQTKKVYTPDLAVAWTPPVKDSTVTQGWTSSEVRRDFNRDPIAWGINIGVVR